ERGLQGRGDSLRRPGSQPPGGDGAPLPPRAAPRGGGGRRGGQVRAAHRRPVPAGVGAMTEPVLTDEYIYSVAPDGKSTQAALDLLRRGAFRQPRLSAGGTRLDALCQGSDPKPYAVRVDL